MTQEIHLHIVDRSEEGDEGPAVDGVTLAIRCHIGSAPIQIVVGGKALEINQTPAPRPLQKSRRTGPLLLGGLAILATVFLTYRWVQPGTPSPLSSATMDVRAGNKTVTNPAAPQDFETGQGFRP